MNMNALKEIISDLVDKEKTSAIKNHGYTLSDYEGLALLREEICEAQSEIKLIFLERLNLDDSLHRDAIMEICKILISTCDAIYMLSNWEISPGARMERDYAKSLGLEILYEQEDK